MILVLLFIYGIIFGSFFNVVIWRVPRNESLISPNSYCPECKRRLRPSELIPLVSYLIQKGQCHGCQARISIRYPLVELVTGVLFVIAGFVASSSGELITQVVFYSFLFVCAIIDIEHKILPNVLVLPGMLIGCLLALIGLSIPIEQSLLGIVAGGGTLLLIAVLSRGGMGMGDVKFIAMIGAFVGVLDVFKILFLASFIGAIVGIIYLRKTHQDKKTPVPFGPFLAMGAFIISLL